MRVAELLQNQSRNISVQPFSAAVAEQVNSSELSSMQWSVVSHCHGQQHVGRTDQYGSGVE